MKYKLLTISLIIILSFGLIITFHFKESETNNGFHRKLLIKNVTLDKRIDLNSKYFYFADFFAGNLFLKEIKHKKLISIDTSLKKITPINIDEVLNQQTLRDQKVYLSILDSIITVNTITGNLGVKSLPTKQSEMLALPFLFDQAYYLSDNEIIIRETVKTKTGLGRKISLIDISNRITLSSFTLPAQIDGYFCTDGQLIINPKKDIPIYMYFYRGEIAILHQNLTLNKIIKTIDTVSMAKMEVSKKGNMNTKTTQSKPPQLINRMMATDNDQLFVLSALKSDNESLSSFSKNQVIDVYSLSLGKYLQSFYIPRHQNQKIRDIRISKDKAYILSGHELLCYSIKR